MIAQGLTSARARAAVLLAGFVLLLICLGASTMLGATRISVHDAIGAITQYDDSSNEQIIVRTARIPRALISAAIGASLAIAGALMQAITGNPLASPTVLGINAGAAAFVVFAITVLGIGGMNALIWIAFGGAAFGAMTVYLLGSLGRDGLSPLRIILAGAAMSALFASVTQGLLVMNENGLNDVLYWLTGSVSGKDLSALAAVLPYMAISWVAALFLGRPINVLIMGEDAAKGLGQRTAAVKIAGGIIIVLLAGSSVAVAGPIGFIGIVIPHLSRFLGGIDYRWVIPFSAVLGAILLLLADLIARFVIMPQELPVGIMTAIIGVPFFIAIARRERKR
ncbi:iron chelate uptake ABC transporter family permease subunit [Paenibacillus sp. MMS18-CY102]|uniref:iron chelate uptake ABC transporter family permease subunit n=1 Tax=Paenibacillus sp. MMS18-CY102 TaxID=2682849 RepID=UPI00136579D2|nr:iron chelate uptake ABC transporter family permease subunit [Paenibacillus sp. MMS18-CY102]